MGNFASCFGSNSQTAKLVDLQGNLQRVKVPITAAEVMLLEEPGHLVSQVVENDLVSCFRLCAFACWNEELMSGNVYLL
ncbi:RNA-directed DNA polymerase, eukaryota [Tanacetum coccineum]